jgi:soluble lytic murein transglycosylase
MLRMLDHYYKGNLPLMVAAYNAGPGVANRWWRSNKHRDTDTLVEQITYPLTMAYTKKVIGSYYAYRVLYGEGSPPPIALQPPQELGEWGRPVESQPVGLR